MFFRKFNFNIYYISYFRLAYFITLFMSIFLDVNSNFFLCSYLLSFTNILNFSFFFINIFSILIPLLIIKLIITRKKNIINFILIDFYLLFSFFIKNINKYINFLNFNYFYSLLVNLLFYFKNIIFLNNRIIYLYTSIITKIISSNFN